MGKFHSEVFDPGQNSISITLVLESLGDCEILWTRCAWRVLACSLQILRWVPFSFVHHCEKEVVPHFFANPSESKGELFFRWMVRSTCTLGQIVGPLKSPFTCSIPFNVSNLSLTASVWKQLFKCQMSLNNCLYSHIIWLKCFLNHALCEKDSCCFHFVPFFVLSLVIILNGSLGKVQQIQEWTISKKKLHFPLSAWPHNSSNF